MILWSKTFDLFDNTLYKYIMLMRLVGTDVSVTKSFKKIANCEYEIKM